MRQRLGSDLTMARGDTICKGNAKKRTLDKEEPLDDSLGYVSGLGSELEISKIRKLNEVLLRSGLEKEITAISGFKEVDISKDSFKEGDLTLSGQVADVFLHDSESALTDFVENTRDSAGLNGSDIEKGMVNGVKGGDIGASGDNNLGLAEKRDSSEVGQDTIEAGSLAASKLISDDFDGLIQNGAGSSEGGLLTPSTDENIVDASKDSEDSIEQSDEERELKGLDVDNNLTSESTKNFTGIGLTKEESKGNPSGLLSGTGEHVLGVAESDVRCSVKIAPGGFNIDSSVSKPCKSGSIVEDSHTDDTNVTVSGDNTINLINDLKLAELSHGLVQNTRINLFDLIENAKSNCVCGSDLNAVVNETVFSFNTNGSLEIVNDLVKSVKSSESALDILKDKSVGSNTFNSLEASNLNGAKHATNIDSDKSLVELESAHTSTSKSSSLLNLPDDIFNEIFSQISKTDIINLASSDKSTRSWLVSRIFKQIKCRWRDVEKVTVLSKYCHIVTDLRLEDCCRYSEWHLNPFPAIETNLPNLKHLAINSNDSSNWLKYRTMKLITKLTLYDADIITVPRIFSIEHLKNFPNLTDIHLRNYHFDWSSSEVKSTLRIKRLSITNCSWGYPFKISQFNVDQNLKTLDINYTNHSFILSERFQDFLNEINPDLFSVTELKINCNKSLPPSILSNIITNYPELKDLTLLGWKIDFQNFARLYISKIDWKNLLRVHMSFFGYYDEEIITGIKQDFSDIKFNFKFFEPEKPFGFANSI